MKIKFYNFYRIVKIQEGEVVVQDILRTSEEGYKESEPTMGEKNLTGKPPWFMEEAPIW